MGLPSQDMFIAGRITGIFAFFFLSLSISGAAYMTYLARRFGGKNVKRFHIIVSVLSFFLVLVHILTLMFDSFRWGPGLDFWNSFVPSFSGKRDMPLALGVIAMYLMLLGLVSGFMLRMIVRKFGYRVWVWIHRLTIPAYVLVYLHARKLGTDFASGAGSFILAAFFQMLFYLTLARYAYLYFHKKNLKPGAFSTSKADKFEMKPEAVCDVKFSHHLQDEVVHVRAYITKDSVRHDIHWYVISDNSGIMHAYSAEHIDDGEYNLSGYLRYHGDEPYIEIREYHQD